MINFKINKMLIENRMTIQPPSATNRGSHLSFLATHRKIGVILTPLHKIGLSVKLLARGQIQAHFYPEKVKTFWTKFL